MKLFDYPEIDLTHEVPMDGWAALKILCHPDHPQHALVKRRTHLVTRTVGARYIQLLQQSTALDITDQLDLGGDQFVETNSPKKALLRNPATDELEAYTFNFDIEDWEAQTQRFGEGSMPDEDSIEAAKLEAMEELEMLNLCGYMVSYWHPFGYWSERKPRLGDLVDVPADLHADIETEEPIENRIPLGVHAIDERYWPDQQPNDVGYTPDPKGHGFRLYDLVDERGTGYSILGDRKGRSMWEVGIWKLAEFGRLQVGEGVSRKYSLRPKRLPDGSYGFTPAQLCKFIVWASKQSFKQPWEWEWITKSISAYSKMDENWEPHSFTSTHTYVTNGRTPGWNGYFRKLA